MINFLHLKEVTISLDNGQTKVIFKNDLKKVGNQLFFEDDEYKLVFSRAIKDNVFSLSLTAIIKNRELFQAVSGFAAHNALKLLFDETTDEVAFMCNYQHKDWWTRPYFGNYLKDVPSRTQSLVLKETKLYQHIMPVLSKAGKSEFIGSDRGLQLVLHPFKSGLNQLIGMVAVSSNDENPFGLVEQEVKYVAKRHEVLVKPRLDKQFPKVFDYLGWCTWDAFYHKVNEEGIFTKLNELKIQEIPVKWMMIDDGWSEVRNRQLMNFNADTKKFPKGLKHTIDESKQSFGLSWVGVWHTIGAYWNGISPDSSLVNRFKNNLYKNSKGVYVPNPIDNQAFNFWNGWHSYLEKEGVDFIKVDSQSAVTNFFENEFPIEESVTQSHVSLEGSAALHFKDAIINCMGMGSENIWSRPKSAISRNSDDFVPQESDSFNEHALQNIYNSYYHGAFYWGDWDMYWSQNHDDKQNMVLRAISGGPIYISDGIGKTTAQNIFPLVYHDGKILRCDRPALPTEDCLVSDPVKMNRLLKTWNHVSNHIYISAYNLTNQVIQDKLQVTKNMTEKTEFYCYDVLNKKIISYGTTAEITIAPKKVALVHFVPKTQTISAIGLTDKLLANHGILSEVVSDKQAIYHLYQGGVFEFISDVEPIEITVDDQRGCFVEIAPGHYQIDCTDIIQHCVLIVKFVDIV